MTTKNKNGSVIIIAMVLGLALAAMAGGYIALTTQSMKHTQRSFYMNTAFNLAESGAEYAVWCIKNTWTLPSGDWTGDAANKTYIGSVASPVFTDSQGSKGYFKIRVTDADGLNPMVIAEGVVVPPTGQSLSKQIRVRLSKTNSNGRGRSDKDRSVSNGGIMDSYSSAEGHASTAPRRYNITVASASVEIGDLSIGSAADIYGYVAIAPSSDSASEFIDTIQGAIMGPSTASGQPGVEQQGANLIDTNRIAYDFTQDFPDQSVPDPEAGTLVTTIWPAKDLLGYTQLGDPTGVNKIRYVVPSVDVATNDTLIIVGPVEVVVSTTFNVAGGGALVVNDGETTVSKKVGPVTYIGSYIGVGEAKLYVKGNISISGNGSINSPYNPAALQVYGTLTEAEYAAGMRQDITIGGNGDLSAMVNAPNADIVMNGGGSTGYFAGSTLARSSRINGAGYKFRFDEELLKLTDPKTYKVSGWAELTNPADKYSFPASPSPEPDPLNPDIPIDPDVPVSI